MRSGASVSVCKEGVHGPTHLYLRANISWGSRGWWSYCGSLTLQPSQKPVTSWYDTKSRGTIGLLLPADIGRVHASQIQWPNDPTLAKLAAHRWYKKMSCKLPLDTQPGCASVHPRSSAMTLQPHHLGKRSLGPSEKEAWHRLKERNSTFRISIILLNLMSDDIILCFDSNQWILTFSGCISYIFDHS